MFQKPLVTKKLYGSWNRSEICRCVRYSFCHEKNTQTPQRFWETRVYRLDKNRLDMMTTRSPLWAPMTTRYATRTCRLSVSRTSFAFPTNFLSRVERAHVIRASTCNSNECRFKRVTSLWHIKYSSCREDFY